MFLTFANFLEGLFHCMVVEEWLAFVLLEAGTLHLVLKVSFDTPVYQPANMASLAGKLLLVAGEHRGNDAFGFRKADISQRELG